MSAPEIGEVMKKNAFASALFVALVMVAGCSSSDGDVGELKGEDVGVEDAGDRGDDVGESPEDAGDDISDAGGEDEDVLTIGDVGEPAQYDYRCGDAIIDEWPLNDAVSDGEVTAQDEGDYRQMTIDASAGGMQGAAENPFVYVRLDTAEKLELTDLEALEDPGWDLAFKRIVIRSNSDDSGPGAVEVAKIGDTNFEDVAVAPGSSSEYATDISFDEDCEPYTDAIGNLITAFNHLNADNPSGSQSWYDYGSGGGMTIQPVDGDIYVVRNNERQEVYKLEILSWESGVYTLRWAEVDEYELSD